MTLTVMDKIQAEKGGRKMVQAVSRRHFTAEPRVRFQDSAFQIRGEQSGTGAGFSPSASVFAYQNHSTFAPYSFIHLPPTLYNVFLPVLQFSPVSIIPPLLHTGLQLKTFLNRRTSGRSLATFERNNVVYRGSTGQRNTLNTISFNTAVSVYYI